MIIHSKYPGACRDCRREIRPGDRVEWTKGTKGVLCEACSPELRAEARQVEASRAETADVEVPTPEGLALLPYQRAGVAAMMAHPEGTLLADEMGLGKTIQVAGLINATNPARVLVIGPKSLALNWMRELEKWLVEPRLACRIPSAARAKAAIVVGTYDEAKKHQAELEALEWTVVVVDECHMVKNPKAQRTKAVRAICKGAHKVIALTGTPLVNRPKELHPILALVAPETWDPKGKGFFRFAKRYCDAHQKRVSRDRTVWDFNGSSNLEELQTRLRGTCMVRRLKADVLSELPAKRRQLVELELGSAGAKLLAEEQATFPGLSSDDPDAFEEQILRLRSDKAAFADASRLRKAIALETLPQVLEHVADFFDDSSEKLVLGAWHHEVINALGEELERFGVVVVTGNHSAEQRQAAVDAFQEEGGPRVFIGQIAAAGVGLTLHRASTVMLVELPWTPGEAFQFEDRCHRIGQLSSVHAQYLVAAGSLQAHMAKVILSKAAVADAALDARPAPKSERKVVEPKPAAPRTAKQRENDRIADALSEEQVALIHHCLQVLAGHCDGARERDGAGFARVDVEFGHDLASRHELTPRQAATGLKFVRKYQRQLAHVDGVSELLAWQPGDRPAEEYGSPRSAEY